MRGKPYTQKDKEKIKKLLLTGKSYSEIEKLLGTPKSTISTWFGKTIKRPINRRAILEHLANIRKLAIVALKKKWKRKREEEDRIIKTNVEKELENYPLGNISVYKSLLAMLYWTEGDKYKNASTSFVNTEPNLLLLYITLLRTCYNIDETKFSIRLRVHYYHSMKKVKNFWAELLNVPLNQFTKISIKKRSKIKRFRKNFAGICCIRYKDTAVKKELLELGSSLQRFIIKNAPVAQRIEHKAADFEVVGSTPTRRT